MTPKPPDLPESAIEFGVKILAHTDAVFRPVRDCQNSLWAAAWVERWGFAEQGIRYSPGGTGPADWQQSARNKALLRHHGLLTEFRSGKSRTYRVALTLAGDRYFRMVVDQPHYTLEFLAELETLIPHADATPDGWIPEETIVRLWGVSGAVEASDRLAVEDVALPSLIRGFAISNADTKHRVFYQLTESGRAALTDPPNEPKWKVRKIAEMEAMYFEERRTARGNLGLARDGEERQLGMIPFPACMMRNGTPPIQRPVASI